MNSQSVKLVSLPCAPSCHDHFYQAHLDISEDVALFQPQWDVHLKAEVKPGLTVDEALSTRTKTLLELAYGHH